MTRFWTFSIFKMSQNKEIAQTCQGFNSTDSRILSSRIPSDSVVVKIWMTSEIRKIWNLSQELPLNVDPADVESTEAKWGLDQYSAKEDKQGYSGKRQLRSFLSFLDFVDTLLEESHKIIGATMAEALRVFVFETRLSHGSHFYFKNWKFLVTNFRIFILNFLQPKENFFKFSLRGFQLVCFLHGISRMEIIRKIKQFKI